MRLILTMLVVFVLLMINELWWRGHRAHGELSRKFVHITVGSFVAFWPFFLSWRQIELLSLAFVLVVTVSKTLHIFKAIHSVTRPTWGELCFALAVGSVALVTHDKWIYMAALLQMSLADGLAAIIGLRLGMNNRYLFFGHAKSVAGTLAFFIASVLILLTYTHYSSTHLTWLFIGGVAMAASILENVAVKGLDNLLVPLLIAVLLVNR
ncbi:MAG TPA: hypothetical protein VH234_03565 [Candidatus Saccharimonadales bacterium]|jgi:dolichol kinase|nr:hypothetical protein [Candidatus Saccharimonadales bacterium]